MGGSGPTGRGNHEAAQRWGNAMKFEEAITRDPALGAAVLLRAHREGTGTVGNAWHVLVDWGAEGDTSDALEILAREAGGMDKALSILAEAGITV